MQEGKDACIFFFTIDFRSGDTVCLSSTLISFQLMVCKLELKPKINLFLLWVVLVRILNHSKVSKSRPIAKGGKKTDPKKVDTKGVWLEDER